MTLLVVAGVIALVCLALWVSRLGSDSVGRFGPPSGSPSPRTTDLDAGAAEVRALIAGGNLIGAIKRYREQTGVGLTEAKEAVEAIAAGRVAPSPLPGHPATDPAGDPEIRRLVREGELIGAIKRYRQLSGAGLKDAKDAIERMRP